MIPIRVGKTKKHRNSLKECLCTCGEGLRNVLSIPLEWILHSHVPAADQNGQTNGGPFSFFSRCPWKRKARWDVFRLNPARRGRSHTQTWVGLVTDVYQPRQKYISQTPFFFQHCFTPLYLSVWENDAICNQLSGGQENKSLNERTPCIQTELLHPAKFSSICSSARLFHQARFFLTVWNFPGELMVQPRWCVCVCERESVWPSAVKWHFWLLHVSCDSFQEFAAQCL